MTQKALLFLMFSILLFSCKNNTNKVIWNLETLESKANQHLDNTKWDSVLFKQDIETYEKHTEIFESYPLNKSPFPVAEYDYAVSSVPFIIEKEKSIFKGVRIGEFMSPDSDKVIEKLTLIILTNDKKAEETTLVDSRNYPYLTAQGYFKTSNNKFDWVFSSSPDGFSILLLNMKLFDLRFGETVIIYPQKDKSFLYEQIKDSPNNYESFEEFKTVILNNPKVKKQLNPQKNI